MLQNILHIYVWQQNTYISFRLVVTNFNLFWQWKLFIQNYTQHRQTTVCGLTCYCALTDKTVVSCIVKSPKPLYTVCLCVSISRHTDILYIYFVQCLKHNLLCIMHFCLMIYNLKCKFTFALSTISARNKIKPYYVSLYGFPHTYIYIGKG